MKIDHTVGLDSGILTPDPALPRCILLLSEKRNLLYEAAFDKSLRHTVKAEVEGRDEGTSVDLEQSYQGRLHAAQWT